MLLLVLELQLLRLREQLAQLAEKRYFWIQSLGLWTWWNRVKRAAKPRQVAGEAV